MIITKLTGGLGNQLFQYALGRHLALKNSQELKINIVEHKGKLPDARKGIRIYGLENFNIAGSVAAEDELEKFNKYRGRGFYTAKMRTLRRAWNRLNGWMYVDERPCDYYLFQSKWLESAITKHAYIEGYWQTEKYFKAIDPVIRRDLTFKTPPDEKNRQMLDLIRNSNSVAVHIRRGDVAHIHSRTYGTLPPKYYEKARDMISQKICNAHYYIFSDEPEWVRNNFQLDQNQTLISHNGDDRNHEDLRLMSQCKHHIIANSTFSWWGAWLAKHPDQIVIAPREFNIGKDFSKNDFYPETWTII